MSAREEAMRLVTLSRRLAWVSLFLLLTTTVIQLTIGKPSSFILAANAFTVGVLSATATLIGKAVRALNA